MTNEKRYRLTDSEPICMECDVPFSKHTPQDAEKCVEAFHERRGYYGNFMYLQTGLQQAGVWKKWE